MAVAVPVVIAAAVCVPPVVTTDARVPFADAAAYSRYIALLSHYIQKPYVFILLKYRYNR